MKPVRTASSNMVYRGPTPDIADLHCERLQPGLVRSVWYLSKLERELIAAGANIALIVLQEPIPPVIVQVTEHAGVGEDAPEALDRLEQLQIGRDHGEPT